jgi:hypothetical protein
MGGVSAECLSNHCAVRRVEEGGSAVKASRKCRANSVALLGSWQGNDVLSDQGAVSGVSHRVQEATATACRSNSFHYRIVASNITHIPSKLTPVGSPGLALTLSVSLPAYRAQFWYQPRQLNR